MKLRLSHEAEPFQVDVKYARLSDFCFICGLVGDTIKEYSSEVDEEWIKPEGYEFGN